MTSSGLTRSFARSPSRASPVVLASGRTAEVTPSASSERRSNANFSTTPAPAAVGRRARGQSAFELALHGGEDYQFLLAIPADKLDGLKDLAVVWDLPLTVIGEFYAGEPAVSLNRKGAMAPLDAASFDHYRSLKRAKGEPKPE